MIGNRARALTLVLIFPVSSALLAQETSPVDDWQGELRRIGGALMQGEYAAAERASVALADLMTDQIVGGVGADLLFGITTDYIGIFNSCIAIKSLAKSNRLSNCRNSKHSKKNC